MYPVHGVGATVSVPGREPIDVHAGEPPAGDLRFPLVGDGVIADRKRPFSSRPVPRAMSACLAVVPWPPAIDGAGDAEFPHRLADRHRRLRTLDRPARRDEIGDIENVALDHVADEHALDVRIGECCRGGFRRCRP